ncbi:MAG: hypothetical protein RLZZ624_598 [Cyanobacteriota bacterium]|jgi:hypothetical protein
MPFAALDRAPEARWWHQLFAATVVRCSATACRGWGAGQILVVIASAAASSLSSARFADIFRG